MLTLLRWSSPYFTTLGFLVPIVLFWALVVSAGMKAVPHCATLTKRVPCADIVSSATHHTRQLMCGSDHFSLFKKRSSDQRG